MRQDPAETIDSIGSQTLTCPRCNGDMEEGFVVDLGAYNTVFPSQWVQGQPEKSLLGTKIAGKVRFRIATYRCRRCGYLESYAKYQPA
ncbi:MAG TPA: PF20097 family protein [Thermoanaerobaculia bacterium]|nr:PF20097 family protein [Thermoanaerobaculia bacterium]